MITVSGWDSCKAVFNESDEWIPLSVSWDVAVSGRLLYLRISGRSGGELEIKVSALNGSLHSLIVLEWPPEYVGEFTQTPISTVRSSVPNINTDLWGPEPLDLYRVQPVFVTAELSTYRTHEETTLVMNNSVQIATAIECEFLSVGVAESGELVSFTAKRNLGDAIAP
ncbi:hypothetical protein ACFU44_32735 [Nocardia rhizosphaerihabitans]|uniref:hypothetical protein n=1 Tax=Nocardia rhizosphaerihabitans TaxID=1691570 RepID=UPI003671BCE9